MRRWSPVILAFAACAGLGGGLAGCGADGDASGPCGSLRREPLDRRAVHVLPGAEEVDYLTDPPTSGPHLAAPSSSSVRDAPLEPAVQVGLLEEGRVLLQHTGLSPEDRAALEGLAGDGTIVAPAPTLPEGATVIATAWVTKQVCTALDLDALEGFVVQNRDRGPGHA